MPRKNNRKPSDPDVVAKRRHQWKHNSFFGHARMMQSQCETIMHSDSASPDAKDIARHIQAMARELTKALKERLDPK